MTGFREKAIFIWNDYVIGDAAAITKLLVDAGFEAAHLHSTSVDNWRTASRVALAAALKAAGIKVYASCAVYGTLPAREGLAMAEIVNQYNLDGAIFDAEKGAIETSAIAPDLARQMLSVYKDNTSKPAAWCWWAMHHNWNKPYNPYHPVEVLREAMKIAEVGMPMAYWNWGDDAASALRYLEESWKQWREITSKPIVMAGRACVGDGGTAKAPAMLAYDKRARELGAVGLTWWSMEHALKLEGVWEALFQMPKMGGEYPEEESFMYKTCPIGLVTKTGTWTNPSFKFVAGVAHEPRTMEPNAALKPIETKAAAQKIPFGVVWKLDITEYSVRQLGENNWPSPAQDWQLNKFIEAVKNRDPRFVVVWFGDEAYKNYVTGLEEDEGFVSFVGQTLTGRIGDWLRANKPNCKLMVGASDPWIKAHAPNMDNWVAQYERGWIVQVYAKVADLDESYPPATDKPGYLGASNGWRFWEYFTASNGDSLVIHNALVDPKDLYAWLGFDGGVPVPDTTPPAVPAGLRAVTVALNVGLDWGAVADAAAYKVYSAGVQIAQTSVTYLEDIVPTPGTYVYQVSAVDAAGNESALSAGLSVVVQAAPAEPEVSRAEFDALVSVATALATRVAGLEEKLAKARITFEE